MRLSKTEKDLPFFGHKENDICRVIVHKVQRGTGTSKRVSETTRPTDEVLAPGKKYDVHPGYRRFLLGFLREIDFAGKDGLKSHNALFREIYLLKILDLFAIELENRPPTLFRRFRSRVLNPLLQRQLQGIPDHEAEMARMVIPTPVAAAEFYLKLDPILHLCERMWQRGILYIWPVRMSFSLLRSPATEEGYKSGLRNTKALLEKRIQAGDDYDEGDGLYEFELKVVRSEGLQSYFPAFIPPVSAHCSLIRFSIH